MSGVMKLKEVKWNHHPVQLETEGKVDLEELLTHLTRALFAQQFLMQPCVGFP